MRSFLQDLGDNQPGWRTSPILLGGFMKQGIQESFKDTNLKLYGCYFISLCEWACRDSGKDCTEADVNGWFSTAKSEKWCEADCTILKAHSIYNLVYGKNIYSSFKKSSLPEDKCIICNAKPQYTHFTLKYGSEVWDPLNPNRPAAKTYKIDSYRVLLV
ncbi:MAG: hypothetical protein LBC53_09590 [Spirochaetaceae bacterium]|jgi:hypothetical protein|nr:hypothetical protein [Spirochaetaceae bacterium]